MGRIRRGWALTKQSWQVLRGDKSLVIFPILSSVFAVLAIVAIRTSALLARGVFGGRLVERHDPVLYIAGLAAAYVSSFIAIFFDVALAACAQRTPGWVRDQRRHAADRRDPRLDAGRGGFFRDPGDRTRGQWADPVAHTLLGRHQGALGRRRDRSGRDIHHHLFSPC